jgi:serine/threonine protein kinase
MPQETLIRGEESGITFAKRGLIDLNGFNRIHPVFSEGVEYSIKLPKKPGIRASHSNLRHEYDIQSALIHPHITPIVLFDTTRDLIPGIDIPFFVTPQRDDSLQTRMDKSSVLPISQILGITEDIASALSFIHGNGILHTDLIVNNVLLQEQNGTLHAELTDFEHAVNENEKRLFKKDNMPPELREGIYVATSEQFELARSIIYPMIFGSYMPHKFEPYYTNNSAETVLPPRRPFSEVVPPHQMTEYHTALESVAEKALQEQIPDRYISMAVLLDDLHLRIARAREQSATL